MLFGPSTLVDIETGVAQSVSGGVSPASGFAATTFRPDGRLVVGWSDGHLVFELSGTSLNLVESVDYETALGFASAAGNIGQPESGVAWYADVDSLAVMAPTSILIDHPDGVTELGVDLDAGERLTNLGASHGELFAITNQGRLITARCDDLGLCGPEDHTGSMPRRLRA